MKKRTKKQYQIYYIEVNNIIRYIGMTDNIRRRSNQHNNLLKKGHSKTLYNKIREMYPDGYKIVLKPYTAFLYTDKVVAKRKEMQLILSYYFIDYPNELQLYQTIPNISSR
jgi:hypothetical protein